MVSAAVGCGTGLAGALLGSVYANRYGAGDLGDIGYLIAGGMIGYTLGSFGGTILDGRLQGEKGSILWTLGGTVVGFGIGMPLAGIGAFFGAPILGTVAHNYSLRKIAEIPETSFERGPKWEPFPPLAKVQVSF